MSRRNGVLATDSPVPTAGDELAAARIMQHVPRGNLCLFLGLMHARRAIRTHLFVYPTVIAVVNDPAVSSHTIPF
jgi:hypothetical protein